MSFQAGFLMYLRYIFWLIVLICIVEFQCDHVIKLCGGRLTGRRGVIQTPYFPARYPVPIECQWEIDASKVLNDSKIIVHFTQVYVIYGLTLINAGSREELGWKTDLRVINVDKAFLDGRAYLGFKKTFLLVKFKSDTVFNNHFRALTNILDVYGFNITYEIIPKDEHTKRVHLRNCTLTTCSFNGNCYANSNFM